MSVLLTATSSSRKKCHAFIFFLVWLALVALSLSQCSSSFKKAALLLCVRVLIDSIAQHGNSIHAALAPSSLILSLFFRRVLLLSSSFIRLMSNRFVLHSSSDDENEEEKKKLKRRRLLRIHHE